MLEMNARIEDNPSVPQGRQTPPAHSRYLIAGSSHAALEAASAIRMHDEEASLTLISRDEHPPYSPTVLPYVVSGSARPEGIGLRPEDYFQAQNIHLCLGQQLTGITPEKHQVELASGQRLTYDKLLLATGATPALPPVEGLDRVPYHVIRTLDDALGLREAMGRARRAVVLGGGFVGTHAAENLQHAGLEVSLVEMQEQLLPWYFNAEAATLIEEGFSRAGIRILTGHRVEAVTPAGKTSTEEEASSREQASADGRCRLAITTPEGETLHLECDLLVVATGVSLAMDYLAGSGVETDLGICVDDRMRTSVEDIWAAGDVAQARSLLNNLPSPARRGDTMINGILPDAVEQGRIAGMDMAGDPAAKTYAGGLPINTFSYFGNQAMALGCNNPPAGDPAVEVHQQQGGTAERPQYRRLVLENGRLIGFSAINEVLDAGILWQLMRRRTDLGPVREAFIAAPLETGRRLMSASWR